MFTLPLAVIAVTILLLCLWCFEPTLGSITGSYWAYHTVLISIAKDSGTSTRGRLKSLQQIKCVLPDLHGSCIHIWVRGPASPPKLHPEWHQCRIVMPPKGASHGWRQQVMIKLEWRKGVFLSMCKTRQHFKTPQDTPRTEPRVSDRARICLKLCTQICLLSP